MKKKYDVFKSKGDSDYERYLCTEKLLSCQKDFAELCNEDELQFQIVHQVEELLLRLMGYTLVNIIDYLHDGHTNRVLTLFKRVTRIQQIILDQMLVLETMSPKEYQEIRKHLGSGSGMESPGFQALFKLSKKIWKTFEYYLAKKKRTLEMVYNTDYAHGDAYAVAEALADFDILFQRFYILHFQLIQRSIGDTAQSLKGRTVSMLLKNTNRHLFPQLWEIRNKMSDEWAGDYGVKQPQETCSQQTEDAIN